jgi:hypothetical protein
MKVLAAVMAVVLVTVLVVGAALAGASGRKPGLGRDPKPQEGFGHVPRPTTADRQGLMPEVVVTAEMPRLVMATVEVRAVRTVALSGSDLRVN